MRFKCLTRIIILSISFHLLVTLSLLDILVMIELNELMLGIDHEHDFVIFPEPLRECFFNLLLFVIDHSLLRLNLFVNRLFRFALLLLDPFTLVSLWFKLDLLKSTLKLILVINQFLKLFIEKIEFLNFLRICGLIHLTFLIAFVKLLHEGSELIDVVEQMSLYVFLIFKVLEIYLVLGVYVLIV